MEVSSEADWFSVVKKMNERRTPVLRQLRANHMRVSSDTGHRSAGKDVCGEGVFPPVGREQGEKRPPDRKWICSGATLPFGCQGWLPSLLTAASVSQALYRDGGLRKEGARGSGIGWAWEWR